MELEYREFTPVPAVAGHVECFWTLEGTVPEDAPPDRILPDGRTELIWNLSDPFHRHRPDGPPHRQGTALLVGQITSPLFVTPGRQVSLVAPRFRIAALGSFLQGLAAAELTDRDPSVEEVLGRRLRDMEEKLGSIPDSQARIRVLEAALVADIARAGPVDPQVAAAVDLIVASNGRVRMDDLTHPTGLSPRQMERRFRQAVGVTPKRLARIVRFQRLMARLHEAERIGWGQLAISCGYYDQAHLIRDFREFTGCAPGEYFGADHRLAELFLRGDDRPPDA